SVELRVGARLGEVSLDACCDPIDPIPVEHTVKTDGAVALEPLDIVFGDSGEHVRVHGRHLRVSLPEGNRVTPKGRYTRSPEQATLSARQGPRMTFASAS